MLEVELAVSCGCRQGHQMLGAESSRDDGRGVPVREEPWWASRTGTCSGVEVPPPTEATRAASVMHRMALLRTAVGVVSHAMWSLVIGSVLGDFR